MDLFLSQTKQGLVNPLLAERIPMQSTKPQHREGNVRATPISRESLKNLISFREKLSF